METNNNKRPVSQGTKPEQKKPMNQRPTHQETQDQEDDTSSPYVDLDKANFTERPYERPSSLGPDHEPKAGV